MKRSAIIFLLMMMTGIAFGQSTNDILNILITNKTVSQQQADSLRAEAAVKQQDSEAARKSFPVNASKLIQLAGYSQLRYISTEESGKRSGFDIRRARLDIKGAISPYFSYRVQTDFADKPKLLDAYGEIKIADYFTITAGQFKVPFSMENLTSSNKLEMIDRSQVVEALVARSKDVIGNQNGRDIGIQAGGGFLNHGGIPLIEYRLAIFNGSGINVADTSNDAKDLAGRVIINPVKGLSFGGGYYAGYSKAIKPDVAGRSQTRNRFGIEASYIRTRLSLRGEYIAGTDGKTDRAGWYLQAGYFVVDKKLQFLARYDTYDPNTGKGNNITTNYSFGGNFNFNNWSRLQIFYTIRDEQATEISNNYLAMQFQIGF
jgi:phosphate-selective porin OprO and OprP